MSKLEPRIPPVLTAYMLLVDLSCYIVGLRLSHKLLLAAESSGGAVQIQSTNQQTFPKWAQYLVSSSFYHNTAPLGGAVYISPRNCNQTFLDSIFIGNVAHNDIDSGEGGAISSVPVDVTRLGQSDLRLLKCLFQDNWADDVGGAANSGGLSGMFVQTCQFINNTAKFGQGGGMHLTAICPSPKGADSSTAFSLAQRGCEAAITDTVFVANRASQGGGAQLRVDGFTLSMINATFMGNEALEGAGGVFVCPVTENGDGSIVLMSGMMFYNNTNYLDVAPTQVTAAAPDGEQSTVATVGALGLLNMLCVAINNSTFDQNLGLSASSAGALKVVGLSGSPSTCHDLVDGALPAGSQRNPPLFQPLRYLQHNSSDLLQPTSLDLRYTNFTNNVGGIAGGMYLHNSANNNATISYCKYRNNTSTAGSSGGISALLAPDIFVTQTTFTDQHAHTLGGAISVDNGPLTVNGSFIQGCTAETSGGGIAARQASVRIFDSVVSNNTAGLQGGGAVACVQCSAAIMRNSVFVNNTSHEAGGVLRADADTQIIVMELVRASGNRYTTCCKSELVCSLQIQPLVHASMPPRVIHAVVLSFTQDSPLSGLSSLFRPFLVFIISSGTWNTGSVLSLYSMWLVLMTDVAGCTLVGLLPIPSHTCMS